MAVITVDRERIKGAWEGRISGCQLGKPVELLSILRGRAALRSYLEQNHAWPLRDYVPLGPEPLVALLGPGSCKGHMERSEPDDDINYTVLALMMLERHGLALKTTDVALSWLKLLPGGATFTAERAAYAVLLKLVPDAALVVGLAPGFDLSECSDNQWSDWIGAQIRADLYGWTCPGRPGLAARLCRQDAALSHRGEGVHAAAFIAALAAAIPVSGSFDEAVSLAAAEAPAGSATAEAVALGRSLAGQADAALLLHERYQDLNPVHAVNNLALVVMSLLANEHDFSAAIGDAVAAGWDTDCNGATVGGLWGLSGKPIPRQWTEPWQGRVAVSLAGVGELSIEELVERTVKIAEQLGGGNG
jgi:ADP-ribosylglycohydrolase